MTNWQRKSDHLLREIVKFQTYIDSLAGAQKAKEAFYVKKEGRDAVRRDGASSSIAPSISTAATG